MGYRDRLEIAQNNLGSAEDLLKAYQARLEYGTATALDVSQQAALVAGYRAQLPSFESQYRQQVIALSILVGIPPERISFQRCDWLPGLARGDARFACRYSSAPAGRGLCGMESDIAKTRPCGRMWRIFSPACN